MTFGFYLLLTPVMNIIAYIPLIGKTIASIIGFAVFFAALIVAFALSTVTVSLAWLFFRPLITISLLAGMGVIVYVLILISERMIVNNAKNVSKQAAQNAAKDSTNAMVAPTNSTRLLMEDLLSEFITNN